jgi:hypothetical protein
MQAKKNIMVNEAKQNNAPKTIILFSAAPMHMLFLGVTKHLMAHVDHLFGNKSLNF